MSTFKPPFASAAELDSFVLEDGELAWDYTNSKFRMGNGITLGGLDPVFGGSGVSQEAFDIRNDAQDDRLDVIENSSKGIVDSIVGTVDELDVDISDPRNPVISIAAAFVASGGGGVPIGAIMSWQGGYFADSANGGFIDVLGSDIATINAYIAASGFAVMDGTAPNDPSSPIYNTTERHLPNLTDGRFLKGSLTSFGSTGGSATNIHVHTVDIGPFTSGATTLSTSQMPSHRHTFTGYKDGTTYAGTPYMARNLTGVTGYTAYAGSGYSHTHSINPPAKSSGNNSVSNNEPAWLATLFIQKIK